MTTVPSNTGPRRAGFPNEHKPFNKRMIIALGGSTRFFQRFAEVALEETLAGNIVLGLGTHSADDDTVFAGKSADEIALAKAALEDQHLDKIELAHVFYVLNVGGYIGKSTAREIAFAWATHTRVWYLERDHSDEHEQLMRAVADMSRLGPEIIRQMSSADVTAYLDGHLDTQRAMRAKSGGA